LIRLWIIRRANVDNFPIYSSGERREALESDVEDKRVSSFGWIVAYGDIIDVYLCHLFGAGKTIIISMN